MMGTAGLQLGSPTPENTETVGDLLSEAGYGDLLSWSVSRELRRFYHLPNRRFPILFPKRE